VSTSAIHPRKGSLRRKCMPGWTLMGANMTASTITHFNMKPFLIYFKKADKNEGRWFNICLLTLITLSLDVSYIPITHTPLSPSFSISWLFFLFCPSTNSSSKLITNKNFFIRFLGLLILFLFVVYVYVLSCLTLPLCLFVYLPPHTKRPKRVCVAP
jgi:hypothetical protein